MGSIMSGMAVISVYTPLALKANMALLVNPDFSTKEVLPANGKKFTLKEMQDLVGGGLIQEAPLHKKVKCQTTGKFFSRVWCNEEGLLKGFSPNLLATQMISGYHYLVGPVVFQRGGEF